MKKYTDLESMIQDGLIPPEMLKELPNCITIMQTRLIDYIPGQHIILAFPVLEMFLNNKRAMQGGFIAAAFDNAFGWLIFFTTRDTNIPTLDLTTNFHRPIFKDDELIVTATMKHFGGNILLLAGEGYNKEDKLIATASGKFIRLGSLKRNETGETAPGSKGK